MCTFVVRLFADKCRCAFAIHGLFTILRGVLRRILLSLHLPLMKYSESLENLDKCCICDFFIDLIVIMEKLNDNPCALAIVLQGNHSHDVSGIFSSYVGKQHQWWKALIIINQILNPSMIFFCQFLQGSLENLSQRTRTAAAFSQATRWRSIGFSIVP